MSEPINRDAMHLAIHLYAARIENGYGAREAQAAAVEDARELILANRKLQRTTHLSEPQQIFDRISMLMGAYGITVQFMHASDGPGAVVLTHESFGKISVPS